MEDIRSPDMLLRQTSKGISRTPIGDVSFSESGTNWKDKWDITKNYKKGDIVWTEDFLVTSILGIPGIDMTFETCGFIALVDVPSGGDPPYPIPGSITEEDVSSQPDVWDIFPNPSAGDLIFARPPARVWIDVDGTETSHPGPILWLELDTGNLTANRIELDANLATARMYVQSVTFKNASGVDETRLFVCSDPL